MKLWLLKIGIMKNIYFSTILISFISFLSCSKDIFKPYDDRIIGSWKIEEVNRVGFGGDTDKLPFKEGVFTFNDNGSLTYISSAGTTFQGSWTIVKKRIDDTLLRSLQITVVDFVNQTVLSEYYDDLNFTGTDRFKAKIMYNFHTYVTKFSR
jgi:hypothetical protein